MEANPETPISQARLRTIHDNAVNRLISGTSPDDVAETMKQSGLGEEEAWVTVTGFRVEIAQAKLDAAKKNVRNGALWCVGGLLVTGISYSMVSEGGGSYFVCWGAVIFGGIQLIRGMVASGNAQKELDEVNGISADAEEVQEQEPTS
jgi:hypothetical protein